MYINHVPNVAADRELALNNTQSKLDTMEVDTLDRHLLNLLQIEFPLCQEPFAVLGARLKLTGDHVIDRVRRCKDAGMIRWISASFDSSRLGYATTLVAMRIPDGQLDRAAEVISAHQGVGHNYARDHHYNLWFTLTVPEGERLEDALPQLTQAAGAEDTVSLPALQVFKRRVYFDMLADGDMQSARSDIVGPPAAMPSHNTLQALTDSDRAVISLLQEDLPLTHKPFGDLAANLHHMDGANLIRVAESLRTRGLLVRYGALLNQRKAGFIANALTCWSVPPHLIEQAGSKAAAYHAVSHCYCRQENPKWPYNLFAMIHGRSRQRCEDTAKRISHDIGQPHCVLLYTVREYKKSKVPYFGDMS